MGEGLKRSFRATALTRLSGDYLDVLAFLEVEGLSETFIVGSRVGRSYASGWDFSAVDWAGRRLAKLRNLSLVEQPKRGWWEITDEGRRFLNERSAAL
jgi:hypothetical protein